MRSLANYQAKLVQQRILMYKYEDIKAVHLEITDKCNAACPQCERNVLGGKDNPFLPITELSLEDIKNIFPKPFIKRLKRFYMCGNCGDPIIAQDTLEILKWIRELNDEVKLGIHTNGSARTTEWWKELGSVLKSPHGYVKFGIDGLEDTNHIYRRRTNWQKIIQNVKAFIGSGGNAHWHFIVFKHNEHQVENARQLAEEIGFTHFQVKKTGRFFSNTTMSGRDKQEVLDIQGNLEYFLEKTEEPQYQNTSLEKEEQLKNKHGNLDRYLDRSKINCKVANEKSIYISSEGLVFPCCWTANQMYLWYNRNTQINKMLEQNGGKEQINAKTKSVKEIVNGNFFRSIAGSWQKPSCSDGKLKVCAKMCGMEFDPFKDQFK